jgi:hypothetical protein
MRNLGKVLGPVIGGFTLTVGSFDDMLIFAASLLLALAVFLAAVAGVRRGGRLLRIGSL